MDGVYRVETVCIYNKSWHHLPTSWSSCHPNYPEVATNFSEYRKSRQTSLNMHTCKIMINVKQKMYLILILQPFLLNIRDDKYFISTFLTCKYENKRISNKIVYRSITLNYIYNMVFLLRNNAYVNIDFCLI